MCSKQLTQEQETYLCFDRKRQTANRIILIFFVILLICVTVSWNLTNISYLPALILSGVLLICSVCAFLYMKNAMKKHKILYAAAHSVSAEVAHEGLFGELWEEFEYNQFEGLTDGKVTFAAAGSESIELTILRKKREYIIEIDSQSLYMIVDEETDTPVEKEVPLSEFADMGEVFSAIREFVEN